MLRFLFVILLHAQDSVVAVDNVSLENNNADTENELLLHHSISYLVRKVPLGVKDTTCYVEQNISFRGHFAFLFISDTR